MRTYTSDGKVYHGFRRTTRQIGLAPSDILVVAWFEGEPDLWLCDDLAAIAELRRYYTDEWGRSQDIPFDVWTTPSK